LRANRAGDDFAPARYCLDIVIWPWSKAPVHVVGPAADELLPPHAAAPIASARTAEMYGVRIGGSVSNDPTVTANSYDAENGSTVAGGQWFSEGDGHRDPGEWRVTGLNTRIRCWEMSSAARVSS
jgi:hypothetical protein